MKLKISIVFALLAAGFVFLVFKGGYLTPSNIKPPQTQEALTNDSILNKISQFDLRDYNGDKISYALKDEKSQKIVIHLWASWCGPCVNEVPELVEYSKKHRDIKFIIVSLDDYKEDILKFLKSFPEFNSKVYFQVWDTEKKISELLQADRLPMSVLIDRKKTEPQFIKAVVPWKSINF